MGTKQFFRRPELLLLFGMLICTFTYNQRYIDIQLHDTYFVLGSMRWMGNPLFWGIDVLLLVSGLLHILLRRRQLLSPAGHWIYVVLGFILLIAIKILSVLWDQELHRRPTSISDVERFSLMSNFFPLAIVLIVIQQMIFWINAALLFLIFSIKKRRRLQGY